MDEAEFDKFAFEYRQIHAANIRITGEPPEYFAEYKVADVSRLVSGNGFSPEPAILDFGAGVGASAPYFRKYFPRSRLTCLDVSRQSLDIGAARFGNDAEFVHFDGGCIPFGDASFDLTFLACVLHHIPHEEHPDIMAELYRVLRPGGAVFIFEHNPYNPLTRHAVNTCSFDENAILVQPARLRASVAAAGFHNPAVDYRIFFPHVLRGLRRLEPYMQKIPLGGQYRISAWKK